MLCLPGFSMLPVLIYGKTRFEHVLDNLISWRLNHDSKLINISCE